MPPFLRSLTTFLSEDGGNRFFRYVCYHPTQYNNPKDHNINVFFNIRYWLVLWFSEQFFCFLATQPHNLCYIDRWDNYVNDTSAKMCEEEDLDIFRYWWKWRKPRGVLWQLVCGLRFEYRTFRIQSRVLNDQPRRSVRNILLIDWLRNGFVNLGVRHGKFGEFRQSFKRQRSPVTVAWRVLSLRMDEMACRGNANKQSRVADGVWIIQPVYWSRTNDNSS